MANSHLALAAAFFLIASPAIAQTKSAPTSTSPTQNQAVNCPGYGMMGGGMGYGMGPGMMGYGMGRGMGYGMGRGATGDGTGYGMGRGMGYGMGRGMAGGGMGYGMGPGRHRWMRGRHMAAFVAGGLAYLKAELKITAAQEPKWQAFADAIHKNVTSTRGAWQAMRAKRARGALPARLARREQAMTNRIDAFKRTAGALTALYAVLSPEQKEAIDGMPLGPMGMPMGMW